MEWQRDSLAYEKLRDEFLMCRTVSHGWEEVPSELERPEPGYWWFVLRCMRCKTERIDLIDTWGVVASRRYRYPDGYEIDEKFARSEIRNEWAFRHRIGLFEADVTAAKKRKSK